MVIRISGQVTLEGGSLRSSTSVGFVEPDNLFMSFDAGNETSFSDGQDIPDAYSFVSSVPNITITADSEGGTAMKWHSADGGYVEYFGSGRAIRAVASDYSDLNNATSISISAWANPRITSRRAIASRWWSGQAQQFNHLFENAPAGRFWYDSRGAISGKYGATDSGLYNINEWSHFVWLYDVSDGFARWYVNGVEKDAIDWGTDGGNGMSVGAFTTPIGIGTRADIYETFDGFMGSLKIYTDVLTPTEISDVFNNEKSRFGL